MLELVSIANQGAPPKPLIPGFLPGPPPGQLPDHPLGQGPHLAYLALVSGDSEQSLAFLLKMWPPISLFELKKLIWDINLTPWLPLVFEFQLLFILEEEHLGSPGVPKGGSVGLKGLAVNFMAVEVQATPLPRQLECLLPYFKPIDEKGFGLLEGVGLQIINLIFQVEFCNSISFGLNETKGAPKLKLLHPC